MAIKKKPLLVATWQRSGSLEWDGAGYGALDTCSSTSILLRTDIARDAWHDSYDNAVSDLKVKVWFDGASVLIDVVVCEAHNKTERELEVLLKTLKDIRKKSAKAFKLDQFLNDDPTVALIKFFTSLGIKQTVIYPELYSRAEYPKGSVLDLAGRIGKHIASVRSTFKKREAA